MRASGPYGVATFLHSPVRNGDIRQMLVNAAINDTLVEQMFRIVEKIKITNSSQQSLQSLELSPCGYVERWNATRFVGKIRLEGMPEAMERSWLATQRLGGDVGIEVVQTEVYDMKGWLAFKERLFPWPNDRPPAWLEPTFRRL
jgi:hypothetical protein